jgi:ATP-dependent helicase/nuclease subunit B
MSAAVFLFVGPVSSGKTRALLTRYRDVAGAGIGTALWLAPTERARDDVLARAVGEGGALLAPNVVTFPDFARQVVRAADPAARPLPEFHQRLLLDDVLATLHARGKLSHFAAVAETRGFADAVFGFLTEQKGQGVTPEEFARTAGHVAGRGRAGRAKDRQVAAAFAEYQRRLEAAHVLDRDATYRRAGELVRAGRLGPFAGVRAAFVDGFADFTPPQFTLLDALTGRVDQVWVALVHDRAGRDDRTELFERPLQTLERLKRLAGREVRLVRTEASATDGSSADRPAGLVYLEAEVFKPARHVVRGPDAAGVSLIEAPGQLGEVRLVAREVKSLLLAGTPAESIVLTARDLGRYADLVREVFAGYGIPLDLEGQDPLARCPAVAMLLRAVRLADEDFPFAATTALLRSTYFRPDWAETRGDPDVALHAEALLRMLGEPRGRDAYLRATARWAHEPEPPLEDEQAEGSRRRRQHELAGRCGPFLERFFAAWDGEPHQAALGDHVAWLRRFADGLGLTTTAERSPADAAAWGRFWAELEQWSAWEPRLHRRPPRRGRADFFHLLHALAASAGVPRTAGGPGCVRALSAEQARHLACDHLFLLGLGERNFPDLGAAGPLYDDAERQTFRQAGLEVACAADRLPDEMLLFYQLVTRPRRALTLSYPAVDDKGQALLPSSFLRAVTDAFEDGAIPVVRRRMLIEGFDRDRPLSPGEYRVRWAAAGMPADADAGLSGGLADHLRAAAALARERFSTKTYSPYDGLLRHPGIVADVGERFGPDKVFSPTALESYVACPFRFFLEHVLKLEPLDDPAEEVEHTRRGAAVHRALSRLHRRLQGEELHEPTPEVDERLAAEVADAVEEYAARVSSPAAQALWRLEGRRLRRAALRYRLHWEKYLDPWRKQQLAPRPHHFEVDFGLPAEGGDATPYDPLVVRVDGIEVRIGGRIDRVDVVDLPDGARGFWVIDYKTGRGAYYSGWDLQTFQRLQLTLYALAVERVLLVDARPLGLAYWLVAEKGHKPAMPAGRSPTKWATDVGEWARFRAQLEAWVATLVGRIRRGDFPLRPRSEDCTQTCSFGQVCRIAQSRSVRKEWELPLPVVGPCAEDEGPPG